MTVVNLHLGKKLGDLLKVKIQRLGLPVDFIISGPPCPPWAGNGSRRSLADARASVFVQVLAWTLFLIKCGGLLCCVMENVTGILQTRDGAEPTGEKFLRILRAFAPEFAWLELLSKMEPIVAPTPLFRRSTGLLSSMSRGRGTPHIQICCSFGECMTS
jgi:site-specific DNA-cytosine methylase